MSHLSSMTKTPVPAHLEKLTGIVERITFHNPENGWTVLKVSPFKDPTKLVAVILHQSKVYAGATMEFHGTYTQHSKHGEQFNAVQAIEKKPATTAALEKYLGSGLIKGIGPSIAKRVVNYFKDQTLEVFENRIEDLLKIPGIADKKLIQIRTSWEEHKAIRDVMIFLQEYGISTLFATKIFKTYGDKAIQIVSENPYRLAHDIYGIGFFSADNIALAMGFERTGMPRVEAGIKHVLAASREEGHCYLTGEQIKKQVPELLKEPIDSENIEDVLKLLLNSNQICTRSYPLDHRDNTSEEVRICYYSKSLYFDELTTFNKIKLLNEKLKSTDSDRVATWVHKYCEKNAITLSDEQFHASCKIVNHSFAILTGGPGCGKTTTTKVIVNLIKAMNKKVFLVAPTGRAAQRMTEVIGLEAKTIHRLLEWNPQINNFNRNDHNPLECDYLIVDETSMLDISLSAALLKAVPETSQVLFIGDPDQLPSVGAGNVLSDLLKAKSVARFTLTKVFRQAQASSIIKFAHEINSGQTPKIISPLVKPNAFKEGIDCLFVDADEATQEQIHFIHRAKQVLKEIKTHHSEALLKSGEDWQGRISTNTEGQIEIDSLFRPPQQLTEGEVKEPVFLIPEKFKHVDLLKLSTTKSIADDLNFVLKKIHPWSTLNYGMTALDSIIRLYTKTIPEWLDPEVEIQVLTPQVRGSVGAINLNAQLQKVKNPESPHKKQISFGERIFRVWDRVIQTRNNYDLGVYNGDIGKITHIDTEEASCEVTFSGGLGEERHIIFEREHLSELSLAYAITIHKSQGSEFQVVVIPVLGQHFNMLFRNLIYTALTRAKKLALFVGTRKAFFTAVQQVDNRQRQTALADLLNSLPNI